MSLRRRVNYGFLFTVTFASVLLAQENPYAAWVERLGDENQEVRQEASEFLAAAGEEAWPALLPARVNRVDWWSGVLSTRVDLRFQ